MNFGLYCENQIYAMYSAFMIVGGGGMLAFLMIFIADWFGRKFCFFFVVFTHITSISFVYVAKSSLLITVIAFTLNMASVFLWYSNVTIFMNESLGGVTRLISMPSVMVARSFGIIAAAVLFYFMPHYIYSSAIGMICMASIGPGYLFLQETLFYQFQKGKLGNLYSSAKKICGMNFAGTEKKQRKNYIYKMLFCLPHNNDEVIDQLENHHGLPIDQSKLKSSRLVFLEEQLMSSMGSISVNYSQEDLNKSHMVDSQIKKSIMNLPEEEQEEEDDHNKKPKVSDIVIEEIKQISLLKLKNEEGEESKEPKNYFDILKIKNLLRLFGIISISSTIITANGLTAYSIQSVGFSSIYSAGIAMGVFDMIGGLGSIYIVSIMTSKNILIIGQLIFLLSSSILLLSYYYHPILLDNYISESKLITIEIFASISIRFGVSLCQGIAYSYTTELFATHLRAITFGITFTFARLGMAVSEVFIHYFNHFGINPNAAIFFFAILSFPISLFMPTTKIKMSN
jgi:MFS family permease